MPDIHYIHQHLQSHYSDRLQDKNLLNGGWRYVTTQGLAMCYADRMAIYFANDLSGRDPSWKPMVQSRGFV